MIQLYFLEVMSAMSLSCPLILMASLICVRFLGKSSWLTPFLFWERLMVAMLTYFHFDDTPLSKTYEIRVILLKLDFI